MKIFSILIGISLISLASAILPPKCDIEHCGTKGALARCTQTHPFKVTDCASWWNTKEAQLKCKRLDCSGQSCYFIPLLASDGKLYCTPCHIHQVSCRTGFKVFGPVGSGSVSRQEVKGLEPVAQEATEVTSRQAQKVLDTTEGSVSRKSIAAKFCSMRFCTKNGARARCSLILPQGGSKLINCYKFSYLPQSVKECSFFCPLFCLPEDQQPIANTGEKFCTGCQLRLESCRTRYKVFGPVTSPTPKPLPKTVRTPTWSPTCSVHFCSMSGRNGICNLTGKKAATCADYAKTEQKKKDCAFACIQICVDPDVAPIDNFGKKYCSVCHLQLASCESDFKIFQVKK